MSKNNNTDYQNIFSLLNCPVITLTNSLCIQDLNLSAKSFFNWSDSLVGESILTQLKAYAIDIDAKKLTTIEPGGSYRLSCHVQNLPQTLHIYRHVDKELFTLLMNDVQSRIPSDPYLQKLIEDTPYVRYCVDTSLQPVQYNHAFLAWLGCDNQANLSQRYVSDVMHQYHFDPTVIEELNNHDKQVLQQAEELIFEINLLKSDASHVSDWVKTHNRHQYDYLVKKSPIIADDSKHITGVVTTVLPINLSPSPINCASNSPTLTDSTDQLANINHNLRTPLHTILGTAELLHNEPHLKQQNEFIENILSAGKNLGRTIEKILQLSELESLNRLASSESFNTNQLLQEICTYFEPLAQQKQLNITLQCDSAIPDNLLGNPKEYQMVLSQLIDNAIKFTETGTIEVNASCTKLNEHLFELLFQIKDTGIGIEPKQIPHIFKRYYRVNNAYSDSLEGSGIGLAIVKTLTNLLNAKLTVTSTPKQGSIFSLTCICPLAKENTKNHTVEHTIDTLSATTTHKNEIHGEKPFILLVEDDPLVQRFTTSTLESLGYQVENANTGQQAITQINPQHNYDLIFMDIGLPDKSGLEVTQYVRQFDQHTKIIALTAHVNDDEKQACFNAGVNDFMNKPVSRIDLKKAVEQHLIISKSN